MPESEASDEQPTSKPDSPSINLNNITFISTLGKGTSAKVMLAETNDSHKIFAIKIFKKEALLMNQEVRGTKAEKDILAKATRKPHPFVVQLHAAFQTETRLYLVLEYVSGGDLGFHLEKQDLSQERGRFYGAEVCLALKFLHENGILYRDVKLDNVLLAPDGHVKVIDFGISKEGMGPGDETSSFVGTSLYMAPEMLLDNQYGFAIDWWGFGILMYQLLRRQPPFLGEDVDEIYDAILQDEPLYPADILPPATISFLQNLLTRNPELRLGSGPADAEEVMKHEYFAGTDWEGLYYKRVSAPFIPVVSNKTDTRNFNAEYTSKPPVLTPVQSFVLTQAMQDEFRGFSSDINETYSPNP